MVEMNERICTIPLGEAYEKPRNKRTPKAVSLVREYASKHMKVAQVNVSLSTALNSFMWERSIQKPPRSIKVKLIKAQEQVRVMLEDEKTEVSKTEKKETKTEQKAQEKTENKVTEKEHQKSEKSSGENKHEEKTADKKHTEHKTSEHTSKDKHEKPEHNEKKTEKK